MNNRGKRLTSFPEQDSSKDWAITQMHPPLLESRNHLPNQHRALRSEEGKAASWKLGLGLGLTLFIVKDHTSDIVHDVTSPYQVYCRRDGRCSAPLIEYAEVGRSVVYGRIVFEAVIGCIVRCILPRQLLSTFTLLRQAGQAI